MILNWNHRLFNTVFMACAEIFRNSHPAYASRGYPARLTCRKYRPLQNVDAPGWTWH